MWKFERCVCQLHNQDWTINVILSQYYVLLGLFNGDYLTTFWLFVGRGRRRGCPAGAEASYFCPQLCHSWYVQTNAVRPLASAKDAHASEPPARRLSSRHVEVLSECVARHLP